MKWARLAPALALLLPGCSAVQITMFKLNALSPHRAAQEVEIWSSEKEVTCPHSVIGTAKIINLAPKSVNELRQKVAAVGGDGVSGLQFGGFTNEYGVLNENMRGAIYRCN